MGETEKPRRKPGVSCPLRGGRDVSEICHECEFYVHIRGKNPQSEEEIDRWGCSLSFLPLLMIENSQMQSQTAASVQSFRNELAKNGRAQTMALAALLQPLMPAASLPGPGEHGLAGPNQHGGYLPNGGADDGH